MVKLSFLSPHSAAPALSEVLRTSEGRSPQRLLPSLLEHAVDAMVILNHQEQILDANGAACRLFGLSHTALIGQSWSDFPDLQRQVDYTLTPDALPQGHLLVLRPVQDRRAAIAAELRRHQQRVELFSEVTLKIRQSLQLKEILHTTVTEVQRILQADRVLIYQVLPDGTGKAISESTRPGHASLLNREFPEEVFPEPCQHLYAQGRVRAIANIHDPEADLADCLVQFMKQFNIQSKLVVPILQSQVSSQGNETAANPLWGLLIAHQCHQPRQWIEFELELMQQLADQISIALAQAEFLEHLEAAVDSRTAELQTTNLRLQQEISDRKAIERMKDEFIAVVSHELRTPLTSLHSALKILATGRLGSLSTEGQQMLGIANESTERLVRLVNNVLDLQRIEAGEGVMIRGRCSAAELMVQATAAMQPMAQQHQVQLVTLPQDISLWADPDSILQALTNLLSNAIKFSRPGGKVWLTVAAIAADPCPPAVEQPLPAVLFQVQDQGQGIPADQLERIFERFQQVDASDSRRRGGTGLGLAICRKIVEQHGGKIWAESSPNGSLFSFTLPGCCPETA